MTEMGYTIFFFPNLSYKSRFLLAYITSEIFINTRILFFCPSKIVIERIRFPSFHRF